MTGTRRAQPGVAVCTIVRGRRPHLRNLLVGLSRQRMQPSCVVVAWMGGADVRGVEDGLELAVHWVDASSPTTELPLATARNAARRGAGSSDHLIFLDVDVIPGAELVADYVERLSDGGGVWCGQVDYLPPLDLTDWTEATLRGHGRPHSARVPPPGDQVLERPELFWSLSFAITAHDFDQVGGFDEAFRGYGAEDTDFARRVDDSGIALYRTPDATGWHQHHDSDVPPVRHLTDIVANARTYRDRWDCWPMEGWLQTFREQDLVRWDPAGTLLRPTAAGLAAERRARGRS